MSSHAYGPQLSPLSVQPLRRSANAHPIIRAVTRRHPEHIRPARHHHRRRLRNLAVPHARSVGQRPSTPPSVRRCIHRPVPHRLATRSLDATNGGDLLTSGAVVRRVPSYRSDRANSRGGRVWYASRPLLLARACLSLALQAALDTRASTPE